MKHLLLLLFSLLLISSVYSQNYKKVQIHINSQQDIQRLADTGIPVEGVSSLKENYINLFVESSELHKITDIGLSYKVLIDDWYAYFKTIPKLTESELKQQVMESGMKYGVNGFVPNGSMTGHFNLAEVNAQLDTLKAQYPNLISAKAMIGMSNQGRPLYMVKISSSPNSDNGKPEVLYTALHHAREPGGMMACLYYMYYLLENYNTNPSVKYLVDNRQLYFVPVVNPDGYYYNQTTNPSGGGMWRKNRRTNTGGSFGVDLNRNYGPFAYWNSALGGSDINPSSETYRGTTPFSEPEIETIRSFVTIHKFKSNFNYHTYGNYCIFPYGALGHETPDSLIFREYAIKITGWNNYTYGTDLQTVNYSTRGGSDDFMYDGDTTGMRGKIFGMTPEVGGDADGFWAPQARILPIAQENLNPNLFMAWIAGEYVTLSNPNYQQQYFNAGDNVQLKPILKNQGLSTGYNLNCTLTSLSTYATVTNGNAAVDSVQARSTKTITAPMTFTIAPNAPLEQKIKFVFEVKAGTVSMSKDTISIIIGVPQYTFIDTTNNPLTLWTVTATPSTPKWDATVNSFVSAPNSYTDSKDGQYVANATVTLQTTNPINLTAFSSPKLSFWTKWDIETKWDCGVVMASSNNGSTWTALTGQFTKPASGSGKQVPTGMPMYDAGNANWVKEEMDLTAFGGKQIKLKFELRTDGSQQKDGWYLDDIGVFIYGAPTPVELTAFTAEASDNNVKINWSTATELNNKGFEVQRSTVGGPDRFWQTLSFVDGKGTTQQTSDYQFVDSKPVTGKSYYRIKQIDYDGKYSIYGPVEVDLKSNLDYSLDQNYPNPFNPSTVIKYSIPQNDMVTIKLFDVLGSEIAVLLNEYKEAGRYELNFNIDQMKNKTGSGVYFYTIKSGNFVQTRKMIVLK